MFRLVTDPARKITLRKARLGPEEERLDREFWAEVDPSDRVEVAWNLTLELWALKGWDAGEPGLCRSVARVVRG
jgi:hypothetical protein